MTTITTATVDDADEVGSFQTSCWDQAYRGIVSDEFLDATTTVSRAARWRSRIDSGERRVLLARVDGELLGVASTASAASRSGLLPKLELCTIYVLEQAKGTGLAHQLFAAAVGEEDAHLLVFSVNVKAQRFYTKHGFSFTGETRMDAETGLEEQRWSRVRHEGGDVARLEESAFPSDLPLLDVVAKFWLEVEKLLPARELHVVDPYVLDPGRSERRLYAGNLVSLLKPALMTVERMTFIHAKERDGIRELVAQDVGLLGSNTPLAFRKGTGLHARYLVADRARALRMDFSFNGIGKSFGTVSLVEDREDIAGILAELERLDPSVGSHDRQVDP